MWGVQECPAPSHPFLRRYVLTLLYRRFSLYLVISAIVCSLNNPTQRWNSGNANSKMRPPDIGDRTLNWGDIDEVGFPSILDAK